MTSTVHFGGKKKTLWEFFIRLNIGLLHNPEIPILEIYPERNNFYCDKDLHEKVHNCITHTVLCPGNGYNRVLLGNKKEPVDVQA